MNRKSDYEIVIIGAGVIGLAIAKDLADKTNKTVLIIEKESNFGKEYQAETAKLSILEFTTSRTLKRITVSMVENYSIVIVRIITSGIINVVN